MNTRTRQTLIGWGITLLATTWFAASLVLTVMSLPATRTEVVETTPPPIEMHPMAVLAVWSVPPVLAGAGMLVAATRSRRTRHARR